MKTEKKYLYLDNYEWWMLVSGMSKLRNQLIRDGKDTAPVNEILLKLIDAPTKKIKVIREE